MEFWSDIEVCINIFTTLIYKPIDPKSFIISQFLLNNIIDIFDSNWWWHIWVLTNEEKLQSWLNCLHCKFYTCSFMLIIILSAWRIAGYFVQVFQVLKMVICVFLRYHTQFIVNLINDECLCFFWVVVLIHNIIYLLRNICNVNWISLKYIIYFISMIQAVLEYLIQV